jgi:hypothetical protein
MGPWWIVFIAIGCGDKPGQTTGNGAPDTANNGGSPTGGDDTADTAETGSPPPPGGCRDTNPITLGNTSCVRRAACQWSGAQVAGGLGYSMDLGGDLDGDGTIDMVVGAYLEDQLVGDSVALVDAGQVHIWLGADRRDEMNAAVVISGPTLGAHLGYSVSIAPDVNGDGLDELIVGGRGADFEEIQAAGVVQLFFGRTEGWDDPELAPDHSWYGEADYHRAGMNVHGPGDLDGDGFGDLLVTTHNRTLSPSGYESTSKGQVVLIRGQEDLGAIATLSDGDATIDGVGSTDSAGQSTAAADLNGDGHADLIVGAPYGHGNTGRVAVFEGGPEALNGSYTLLDATLDFQGDSYGSAFGYRVAAGDLNGDDTAELVLGAPLADDSFPEAGTVTVFSGDAAFFDGMPTAAHTITGEFDDHQLGTGIVAGPDINGDGIGDLVFGAINAWRGLVTKGGRVYAVHGPSTGWSTQFSAASAPIQIFGASTKDYLGRATDVADLNGDGRADIVAASGFSNVESRTDAGAVYLFWGE